MPNFNSADARHHANSCFSGRAAVDVAAVVSTVRGKFARRHVLAEARRHLLETLCGQEFPRGLDDYIADRAFSAHSRQSTAPKPGRRTPTADQLFCKADFAEPDRWWIAGADGKPPRESSRYELARVASLAVQNAIRATRTRPAAAQDDAPAATASAAAHTEDHRDQASDPPHAVDHPGRDAVLTPAQRAAAVQVHQQAAMPEEYLGCRTTGPATWLRAPENLERLAAFTRTANARRRAYEARPKPEQLADVVKPAGQQQHHANRPDHGRGSGP